MVEQNGLCAICHKQAKPKLFVDHHHESGQVRDLLCPKCNPGIGHFKESDDLLEKAIGYLGQPWMIPQDIPTIEDEGIFARFEIPHWETKSGDRKFRKEKNANLKQWYGINLSQYEWLLAEGNGVCWICLRTGTLKRKKRALYPDSMHVDHDHSSGLIRGLLCNNCNTGIGLFEDSVENLASAIAYLEKWNGATCGK